LHMANLLPRNRKRTYPLGVVGGMNKKESLMKAIGLLITAAGCLGAIVVLGQGRGPAQAPAAPAANAAPLQQGPGIQSANDARYREFVNSKCKNPPQPRGGVAGGGGAAGRGGAAGGAAPAAGGAAPQAGAAGGGGRGGGAAAPAGPPM